MKSEELRRLLDKFQEGTLSTEEQLTLQAWEAELDREPGLAESLSAQDKEALKQRMWQNISRQKEGAPVIRLQPVSKRRWLKPVAAAAVLLALVATAYLWYERPSNDAMADAGPKPVQMVNDLPPGGNKAVLTLADGSTIVLDDASNGTLAQQGNTKVIKLDDGQLAYNAENYRNKSVTYNTIATPKGGQYQLILADGSKVWLNAASSVYFPTAFSDKERKVVITGEAYFEVAHDPAKPFIVTANDMQVQVLGTNFNVNAYTDEPVMQTTLLEGAVKVSYKDADALLKPGQQTNIKPAISPNIRVVENADTELAVAWKNGFTSFKNADIKTLMRQVERWYDVQVTYTGKIPERRFRADIPRTANLSELLQLLKSNNINYRLEGRKLTITP